MMMNRHGRTTPEGSDAVVAGVPLANLPSGTRGTIIAAPMCGSDQHPHHGPTPATAGRMDAMGFIPGVAIAVEANYGHGPVIVRIKGARVAVGRGQAAHLWIAPETGSGFGRDAAGRGRHGRRRPFISAAE